MALNSSVDAERRRFGEGSRDGSGPCANGRLRPIRTKGRVFAAGVDTWSLCWYAEPGSPLHRALRSLATQQAGRAELLPERVRGHRVGWFPDHGLVFVEGHPDEGELCPGCRLASRAAVVVGELGSLGIPLEGAGDVYVRRLDVAVDLWAKSSVEGLALLECVGNASLGSRKVVTYRMGRVVQSVAIKSRAGRSQARLYDKGVQQEDAEPGRWLRLEGQWRFGRAHRLVLEELDSELLRERFRRRFAGLAAAVDGFEVGGADVVADRLRHEVEIGRLPPSRARSVAGYLLLSAVGVPQGARRTRCELERDCRELGLSMSLGLSVAERVDVAAILADCMAPDVWS